MIEGLLQRQDCNYGHEMKKLKPDISANYGISHADMYQMYAYYKKYHTSEIWLLYPFYSDVAELKDLTFKAIQDEDQVVNVSIMFVDLEHYQESVSELFDRLSLNA